MSGFEPVIVAFACEYCAYTAADMAGTLGLNYPANLRIVRLPCTGKVDSIYLMQAFRLGADGVLVAGCLEGDCHFKNGNQRAKRRVAYVKKILDEIGMDSRRLATAWMSAGQGRVFAQVARDFTETIRELGPSPIKGQAARAAA